MADLVIRIAGDVKGYSEALEEAGKQTEDLSSSLSTAAKGAAVVLAALTGEAFLALRAFGEAERASNSLTSALQQQGIYSKELQEKYEAQGKAIQKLTGLDGDAITAGQALMQGMIGQTQITGKLSEAVADLAVGRLKGDLTGAFEVAAKAINGNEAALRRMGIEVSLTSDRAENMRRVTEALQGSVGGLAASANQGLGTWDRLKTVFGDFQEEIGKRLAPAATKLIEILTKFFERLNDNGPLIDFIVSSGAAVAAVTSMIGIVASASMGFLKLKAALIAAQVSTSAMKAAVIGLTSAVGIGLLLVLIGEIYLNWSAIWPRMQAVFAAFVRSTIDLLGALGTMLDGVFNLDLSKIKQGFTEAKQALSNGMTVYDAMLKIKLDERAKIEEDAENEKDKRNDKKANERARKDREHRQLLLEIAKEKETLLAMQSEQASAASLQLQKEEIALLEQIADDKNKAIVGKLKERLDLVRAMQEEQQALELQQAVIFQTEILTKSDEFNALTADQQEKFMQANAMQLQSQILTEKTAREAAALDAVKAQVQTHNTFLKNQQQFGTAYALVNEIMNSNIYRGNKQAFGELAQLQRSSNSTLKSIGKVAAIANITMKTAESAMNVYAGFSTIPFVGPALGVAAAAAVVAFGAEQIATAMSAADGGLITGGIPGRDSVPVMAMPGELIVPTRNYEEVINAVALQRTGVASGGEQASGGGIAHVILELKDNLMDFIEAQTIERQSIGISLVRS